MRYHGPPFFISLASPLKKSVSSWRYLLLKDGDCGAFLHFVSTIKIRVLSYAEFCVWRYSYATFSWWFSGSIILFLSKLHLRKWNKQMMRRLISQRSHRALHSLAQTIFGWRTVNSLLSMHCQCCVWLLFKLWDCIRECTGSCFRLLYTNYGDCMITISHHVTCKFNPINQRSTSSYWKWKVLVELRRRRVERVPLQNISPLPFPALFEIRNYHPGLQTSRKIEIVSPLGPVASSLVPSQ